MKSIGKVDNNTIQINALGEMFATTSLSATTSNEKNCDNLKTGGVYALYKNSMINGPEYETTHSNVILVVLDFASTTLGAGTCAQFAIIVHASRFFYRHCYNNVFGAWQELGV